MSAIKHLALIEANTVTGPAKNLLDFSQSTRDPQLAASAPLQVSTSFVTYHRTRNEGTPQDANETPNEFVKVARAAGIEVDIVGERFRFDTKVIDELHRIVERRAPDIIETHHLKSHFIMRSSGLWKHYPWVAFHHGYTLTDLKMRLYNRLDRWSLQKAARIITVSGAFAKELASTGVPRERISVLHNSINAEWSKQVRDEDVRALKDKFDISANQRVILTVGRLSREKAQVDLVTALHHLQQTQPDINARLLIVGDGPERQTVENMAASHGVSERITFTGQISDVRPYYALSDVFVLPSLSEGSPLVLLEAMAAGLPIVATAVGGVPEMATHNESALLVKPQDPVALAQAIGQVLSDAQLATKLVTNAHAAVTSRHTPESHLRTRTGIYNELIAAKASTSTSVQAHSL